MDFSENNLYPALYEAADTASLKGQKKYLNNFKIQLGVLLVASFVGLFQTDNPIYGKYVAGLSLALFAIVLAVSYQMQSSKHDSNWYYGRAIAESIKTLTWRFMIKGEPFTPESDNQAEKRLIEILNEILKENAAYLKLSVQNSNQITQQMRNIRGLSFEERRKVYIDYRINNQLEWYKRKTIFNDKQSTQFSNFIVAANLVALLFSIILMLNNNIFNITPFIITTASTFISWQQVKRFAELSQAYAITAHEISLILTQSEYIQNENELTVFVADSENAFSREHTLWLARRDVYNYSLKTKNK